MLAYDPDGILPLTHVTDMTTVYLMALGESRFNLTITLKCDLAESREKYIQVGFSKKLTHFK